MPFEPLYTKIEHAKLKCRQKDPHLADLLNHWVIELTDSHPTAATDGGTIYYGRNFLKNQSVDEVLFVLLHEMLHIILEHLPRRLGRHAKKFNVAADIVVNDTLEYHGFNSGNLPLITGQPYKMKGHRMHVEAVYDELPVKTDKDGFDDHSLWDSYDASRVREILSEIKKQSHTPSPLLRRLIKPKETATYPTLHDVLRQFLTNKTDDYTFSRPDRRFSDIYLPSLKAVHERLENIWLVLDVSGSMNEEVLSSLTGDLTYIIGQYPSVDITLSFFSNIVSEPVAIHSIQDLEDAFLGFDTTGGTDFSVIFEEMHRFFQTGLPAATIILTDGHGKAPSKDLDPGNETWWAITESKRFTPEFGQRVRLKGD